MSVSMIGLDTQVCESVNGNMCLYLCITNSVSVYVYLFLSVFMSVCVFVCLCLCICVVMSVCACVCLCLWDYMSSIYLHLCLSDYVCVTKSRVSMFDMKGNTKLSPNIEHSTVSK